jgi:septum formation protein
MAVKPEAFVTRGVSPVRLVLASASKTRAELLTHAGVDFDVVPAHADEAALKESLRAEGTNGRDTALALAELKATRISTARPDDLVLGCDQLLDCEGAWFDKATDRADAARQIALLQGRRHELATAVCAMQGGRRLWHQVDAPKLTMRQLDATDIEGYLDASGDEVIGCVGGYRLEGIGIHLFARIEGDYFAILGLPLLPLLDFLRGQGIGAW